MKLRFNDLPRVVRARFVMITTAKPQDPRVLVFDRAMRVGWFKYVTLVGGLAGIAFALQFLLTEGATKDPYHDREVYAALAGAAFVLFVSLFAIVYRFKWPPPPFPEGNYAFQSALVRAYGGELDIMPIQELGRPTITHFRRNGAYTSSRLDLGSGQGMVFFNQQEAVEKCDAILEARERFKRLLAARDAAGISAVDPFAECTLSGQWTANEPTKEGPFAVGPTNLARWMMWLVPLLLGVAVAGAVFTYVDQALEGDRRAFDRKMKKGRLD